MATQTQISLPARDEKTHVRPAFSLIACVPGILLCILKWILSTNKRAQSDIMESPMALDNSEPAQDCSKNAAFSAGENKVVEGETIEQARLAIVRILDQNPFLREVVEKTDSLSLNHVKHPTKPCACCDGGKLHFVGRNKLPGDRLGLGGMFVCDHCGHFESSNLS